ncbi:endonuclease [Pseudogulbenkiania ferrooxidans]|uniref:Deoxyribonuclease I n=1 Tax=Pseudogulbenkiania ferrooxidans 2002 TaxID=279714 RepID=B9Z555_9NEIS|nr:endonuclease [Pseudogulbenkiania ferrooxidans]EEG08287.1 Deoxyribonuclease I [Pseudogulbenkiania ferrooxidans 2002]
MKRLLFLLLPLLLSACLGHDRPSPVARDVSSYTPPPAEAVTLVSGKHSVGHRDFNNAKKVLPEVFAGMEEDFYCGCKYSGKDVNFASCGYQPRKNAARASRIEWEHVVPAWVLGHQRQCWQQGGRKNCVATDAAFRMAEGDLNNLVPAVGEVNGDRGNLSYGAWTRTPTPMYGQCRTIVDFKNRRVQPREEVRGRAARITLYMHDQYGLRMSSQDRQLMCAWAKTYPVDEWERQREARIVALQGSGNPYVSDPQQLAKRCG